MSGPNSLPIDEVPARCMANRAQIMMMVMMTLVCPVVTQKRMAPLDGAQAPRWPW